MALTPWIFKFVAMLPTIHVLVVDTGVDGHNPIIAKYMNKWAPEGHYNGVKHGSNVVSTLLGYEVVDGKLADPLCDRVKVDVCPGLTGHSDKQIGECLKKAPANYYAIINVSGGGEGEQIEELKEIKRLSKGGTLFVLAAGNENKNIKEHPYYPASYVYEEGTNIVVIGNGLSENSKVETSSYGPGVIWRDGQNVRGIAGVMGGTSLAAPRYAHEILKQKCLEDK